MNLMLASILFLCLSLNANNRLETFPILEDSPECASQGYNMNDASINGEFNIAEHLIKSGDVVFDIGASLGDWSHYVLQRNNAITLHAFEPIPATFNALKARFPQEKASFHNIAIDSSEGLKQFYVYRVNSGSDGCSSLHYRPGLAENIYEIIKVQTVSLDTFCQQHAIKHIDFLKIDTEGNELAVLQGAKDLLASKAITFIQFEYGGTYPDACITLQEVYTLLSQYNFTVYRILPDKLLKITHWYPELETYLYANYLAVLKS